MGNLGEQWRGSLFPRTPQLTGEGRGAHSSGPFTLRLAPGTEYLGPAGALRCGLEVAQGDGDNTGMERSGDAQGGGDGTGIEKGDDGRMGWRRVAPGWSGMAPRWSRLAGLTRHPPPRNQGSGAQVGVLFASLGHFLRSIGHLFHRTGFPRCAGAGPALRRPREPPVTLPLGVDAQVRHRQGPSDSSSPQYLLQDGATGVWGWWWWG